MIAVKTRSSATVARKAARTRSATRRDRLRSRKWIRNPFSNLSHTLVRAKDRCCGAVATLPRYDPLCPPDSRPGILASHLPVHSTSCGFTTSATSPFTPVGNRYQLVEYVNTGGMSMATYVATNVQNFPDPNTSSDDVLAVAAYLSQAVTDAGVSISAWSGVASNLASALGAHGSASGSAAATTTAHSGAVAVDAGSLLYTVTLGGLTGLDRPSGFSDVGVGSDGSLKEGAAYFMPAAAATIDPQWTWYYGPDQNTWLVTALALKRAPPPTGDLTVT